MTYIYYCETCGEDWEESHRMDNRDDPVGEPCPHCESGKKKRKATAVQLSYAGTKSMIRRAGGDWNCLLKKIHKNSGKQSKIHHE